MMTEKTEGSQTGEARITLKTRLQREIHGISIGMAKGAGIEEMKRGSGVMTTGTVKVVVGEERMMQLEERAGIMQTIRWIGKERETAGREGGTMIEELTRTTGEAVVAMTMIETLVGSMDLGIEVRRTKMETMPAVEGSIAAAVEMVMDDAAIVIGDIDQHPFVFDSKA